MSVVQKLELVRCFQDARYVLQGAGLPNTRVVHMLQARDVCE